MDKLCITPDTASILINYTQKRPQSQSSSTQLVPEITTTSIGIFRLGRGVMSSYTHYPQALRL
jgi:hypothetical protein